jgi:cytochrome c oxidase cbb3-type subunit 3
VALDANRFNPYEGNAAGIAEGQRLFSWYNCSGCHANGGGGMGPPLIKSEWLYGDQPANLFESIVKGRPNGMPAWGDKIPEYQVWQLIAYIDSLNGKQPRAASPVRADTIEIYPQTLRPGPEVQRK